MKKILILLSIFTTVSVLEVNAQFLKKAFKNPEIYENRFMYFYLKPVSLDTSKINDQKIYEVEGYFKDGAVACGFVKGQILKEILRLEWPESINKMSGFPGKAFTVNYLGKKSFIRKKDIEEGKIYDLVQKDVLLRDMNTEKYQIRSAIPINVKGQITEDEKIILCEKCSEDEENENQEGSWTPPPNG